jgi:PAS domain S-box-containing protein
MFSNSVTAECLGRLPIERSPLAFIAYDRSVRVVEWNPAAERVFGYTKREAKGNVTMDLIVPFRASDHVSNILNRMWAADFDAHSVNLNVTKDGKTIECEWFNTPVLDTNGKVIGGMSFVRNVTIPRYVNFTSGDLARISDRDLSIIARLTLRQCEVLKLVAEGKRTREIARQLQISVKTVEMHRANIMDALEIRDVPGLVRFAIRAGLISAYA